MECLTLVGIGGKCISLSSSLHSAHFNSAKLIHPHLRREHSYLAAFHSASHLFSNSLSYPHAFKAWEGVGVVASARKLIGSTNPLDAEPGTIRGDLAVQTGRSVFLSSTAGNVIHGSDSPKNGKREIVVQAVLGSNGVTEVSGAGKDRGLCGKLNKVVLAYSGGLDTSVIVPWLRENYGCEVVCFTADVGQGLGELEGLEQKAKASGACQLVVKDLKEEFVRDFIFPCLRAGAIYERKYLLGTSMARPVIAKAMVDVAKEVGADAVSHGCTGKGNDQVRFELTFFALNPELNVVAPWREWDITGREDAIEYAKKHNVPVPVTKKSIYSRDRNLWHLSHEGCLCTSSQSGISNASRNIYHIGHNFFFMHGWIKYQRNVTLFRIGQFLVFLYQLQENVNPSQLRFGRTSLLFSNPVFASFIYVLKLFSLKGRHFGRPSK